MDQPHVLQQLESVLARQEHRYTSRTAQDAVFVFMGNFCSPHSLQTAPSTPAARNQLVKSALDELVAMLVKFPTLAAHAQFVVVPGPRDTGNRVLPIPPFSALTVPSTAGSGNKIAHLHWASNPCRLRWNNREMVIFRYDLLPLLLQHQIRLPSDFGGRDDEDDDVDTAHHVRASTSRLLKTVLDQGTLMPLTSVVPVYWNYSHALSLYPLPDSLVVGSGGRDQSPGTFDTYAQCQVVQTTSFAQHRGAYTIYRPGSVDDPKDENAMDSDDDGSVPHRSAAEFFLAESDDKF